MSDIQKVLTKRKFKRKNEVLPKLKTKESEESSVDTLHTDAYPVYRITQSEDFDSLLQKPVCGDSFFKLKSERSWECERKPQNQLCNYFKLDLERLSAGANCLPLCKRHDIDDSLFLVNHSKNVQTYQNYLDQYTGMTRLKNDKPVEKRISPDVTTTSKAIIVEEALTLNAADKIQVSQRRSEDDLDELLHLKDLPPPPIDTEDQTYTAEDPLLDTNVAVISADNKKISTKLTDDLEDWLDDILDN